MSLAAAKTALAAHVSSTVTALDGVFAAPPNLKPAPWTAYVWPAGPWVAVPTEGRSFCAQADVTLIVDFLASAEDYVASQDWFDARVTELWVGAANGVDVGGDTIQPSQTDPPVVVAAPIGNASFLRVRTTFTPFRWEIS